MNSCHLPRIRVSSNNDLCGLACDIRLFVGAGALFVTMCWAALIAQFVQSLKHAEQVCVWEGFWVCLLLPLYEHSSSCEVKCSLSTAKTREKTFKGPETTLMGQLRFLCVVTIFCAAVWVYIHAHAHLKGPEVLFCTAQTASVRICASVSVHRRTHVSATLGTGRQQLTTNQVSCWVCTSWSILWLQFREVFCDFNSKRLLELSRRTFMCLICLCVYIASEKKMLLLDGSQAEQKKELLLAGEEMRRAYNI